VHLIQWLVWVVADAFVVLLLQLVLILNFADHILPIALFCLHERRLSPQCVETHVPWDVLILLDALAHLQLIENQLGTALLVVFIWLLEYNQPCIETGTVVGVYQGRQA
jgi:hypothetical protein